MANSIITTHADGGVAYEGDNAKATYYLDTPLTSATTVHAAVAGVVANSLDYSTGFWYHMGNVGEAWTEVPVDGMITLNAGFSSFQLKVGVLPDLLAEPNESLVFTVAQTSNSEGLTDSWWVPSTVALQDAPGTGASLPQREITADIFGGPAAESVLPGASGTSYATAGYHISGALGIDTPIKVNVAGQPATAGDDYGTLQIQFNHAGTFTNVDSSGIVSLPSGTQDFDLRVRVLLDDLTETGESLLFTVARTVDSQSLSNSWWVPSVVALQDAPNTGASLSKHYITATSPMAAGLEGGSATAHFTISGTGLDAASTIEASVVGQPATGGLPLAPGTDYYGFEYRTTGGATPVSWVSINTGTINLPSGTTSFDLRVAVEADTLAETGESLLFSVAQNSTSAGLIDSWWVPSIVALQDDASAFNTHFITANPGMPAGVEGGYATARYTVSGATALEATSIIKASVIGQPATGGAPGDPGNDYNGFEFKVNGVGGWTPITTGSILLPIGTTYFDLHVSVPGDNLTEANESLLFSVAQTSSSVGLIDSWWVPSIVALQDAAGTGANLSTHTITAAPVLDPPSPESSLATYPTVKSYATATFNIDNGALGANSVINVNVIGQSATAGVDYTEFMYSVDGGTNWADASSGSITLTTGTSGSSFKLRVKVLPDNLTEAGESVLFTVAQTANSAGLINSWYVSSTVNLADTVVNIKTGKVGADQFVGTSGGVANGVDIFVIPAGTSTAHANSGYTTGMISGDVLFISGTDFDTITNFTVGADKIDLPFTVTAFFNFGSGNNEESLLVALGAPFALAPGVIETYLIGSDTYLFANTSGDMTWTATDDTFIKVVGVSKVDISQFSNFI